MPKNLKFASERRSDQRRKIIQDEMLRAQTFIQMYLPLSSLFETYQQQQHLAMLPPWKILLSVRLRLFVIRNICITATANSCSVLSEKP